MATEEIQISQLELADEVLADMVLPVDTATDTKAVTLKQLKAWLGTSLPIGSIFASVGKIDDERFSLLDGKTISRIGTYEAFCNKVVEKVQAGTWKACTEEEFNLEVSETGQCGKFVVSNDYVRIPKLGNSLYSEIIDGRIPVVGNGGSITFTGNNTEGALTSWYNFGNGNLSIATLGNAGKNLGLDNKVKLTTNPTKSGIEGKLETNPVEVFYYMVISTEGQTAEVGVDINKVYEDLNLKANSDLSNVASVASSFKNASVSWGLPDYSAKVTISKTQTITLTQATFFSLCCNFANNQKFSAKVNGIEVVYGQTNSAYANTASSTFFADKNDVVEITISGGVGDHSYYCPLKGVN